MKKVVCYFGSYDPKYSRNRLTIMAFKSLDWKVVQVCHRKGGISHYLKLILLFFSRGRKADLIFIGVLGHYDVPLAWVLAKIYKKPILFDAFYSLYDTYIDDRKQYKPFSLQSLRFWVYDWISVRLADKIILDTEENINYYLDKFYKNENKFFELPVTADPGVFSNYTKQKKSPVFKVGFYGSFLPLHGVDFIVKTAQILFKENIQFFLLGSGPLKNEIKDLVLKRKLSKKIKFLNNTSYEKLMAFLNDLDLFLAGPFGKTKKSKRVLPAKAVESLAAGVPTVVVKTPATYRLLEQKKSEVIWLNKIDEKELVKVILKSISFFSKTKMSNYSYSHSLLPESLNFKSFTRKFNQIINISLQSS